MGFAHLHVGHKSFHLHKRAQNDACKNGAFTNPTLGQTIDSLKPLNISWDPTCLSNVQSVDIILSAPGNDEPLLQGWKSVDFATGYKVVDLLPRKWNDTASQKLQLTLYQSGTPSFMSPLPAGPVFNATYTAPNGNVPSAADLTLENGTSTASTSSSSSRGKVAAGVLIPLIFIGIGIFAYIRYQRRIGREKRKRWSEAVDKRMSTISTDWKSMSAAGAQAAIRHSMAVSARNSSFSFGAIRPSSQVLEPVAPDMAQIRRPGTGLRNAALVNSVASGERVSRVSFAETTRVSRVSFANDPRQSTESRRTVGSSRPSRAFHSAYAPPVPALPPVYSPKEKLTDEVDGSLSPRQTAGPLTLSPEDIRARIQNGKIDKDEDGIADVLPALTMMRTGSRSSAINPFTNATPQLPDMPPVDGDADDYIIPSTYAIAAEVIGMPEPIHYTEADVASVIPSTSFPAPLQELPVMSPDAMLRTYADRRTTKTSSPPSSFHAGVASGTPDDMLRAYAERQAANSSPRPRLEKRPSLIGGFATALKNRKKKDRDSRTSTPVNGAKPITLVTNNMGYPVTEQNAERQEASVADPFLHPRSDGVGVGSYGGAHYAIGEDDDEQAYGGTAQ
ncbi:hypothetical protein M378DRAFT_163881 [Amanita muscaria Koide BX008]|uniref:Uncharacterized protein n=1 Tax=Amanita muscaria (strain Koide BX008) TaxID=946122 RepID=A0A0C2X5C2_AMAMK|nr:hypothetical protein M378DRAFT_163881 [Amanita muscaria Koide BX008]